MSSNNEEKDSQNNSNNESGNIPLQSEFNGGSNVPPQQNNRSNEENNSGKVNKWKQYGRKWIEPLNLVTIALAIFTYLLFKQASNESKTAENSSQAAQDAVKEQITNDTIMRVRDSIKFSLDTININKRYKSDSITNKKNFEIATNTLNAQIKSLEQTQKDFETENRPIIIIKEIRLDTIFANNFITVSYKIYNTGKFPAKFTYIKGKVGYGLDTMRMIEPTKKWTTNIDNDFLANNEEMQANCFVQIINPYYIKAIKNSIIHVYLFCELQYFSSVLKKSYTNYFVYELTDDKQAPNSLSVYNIVNKQ